MNNKRKNIIAILSIVFIALIAAAAIFVSYRISTGQGIIPTGSRAATCEERCPNPTTPNLLQSCTPPESDGSSNDSVCTTVGRVEVCGNVQYCCPSVGGAWTRDMTRCPSATTAPTPVVPTVTGGLAVCAVCTTTTSCATGLTCDVADGRCKRTDGSTVCFEGGAVCTTTGTATAQVCVPSTTITCSPDCPTACGQAASVITTCTNSCNVATTKQCAATAACGTVDVSITKKAFMNGTTTDIGTVARNQTFTYALVIKNNGTINGTGITITDTLDGENQDLLTFVDAVAGCSFSNSNRTVTCSNISLNAGATKTFTFRVKVSGTAVNGTVINNVAVVDFGTDTDTDEIDLTVDTVVGCNQTCTTNANCSGGLTCDTESNTCRKSACTDSDSCVCPTPTPTEEVTATPTKTPTQATTAPTQATAAPTEELAEEPTAAPTEELAEVPGEEVPGEDPTTLPETGIMDFPGIAAFAGGLMLAIVGILLAL